CATQDLPGTLQNTLDRASKLNKQVDGLYHMMLPTLVDTAVVVKTEGARVGIQVTAMPKKLTVKLAAMIASHVHGNGVVVSGNTLFIHSKTKMAKTLLKKLQDAVGGRGGGSEQTANGMLTEALTCEQMADILQDHPG
ncbi:MAG: hypothetical protein GY809_20905, partial [Planctomycetes bacterium]|nr:hypothetical protein [Planctomycetota bacterium]